MSIFMIITLYSLSGRLLCLIWSFSVLSYSLIWNTFLCLLIFCLTFFVCFYVLGKTAFPPILKGVALCRAWTLLKNLVLGLGCLSNLCDYLISFLPWRERLFLSFYFIFFILYFYFFSCFFPGVPLYPILMLSLTHWISC